MLGSYSRLFLVCSALILGAACATAPPKSAEEAVRERAQAWLDALMAFDFEGSYQFTTPAYQTAHSVKWYSKNYGGRNMWRSASLGDIRCDESEEFGVCEVDLVLTYRGFNMPDYMTSVVRETWVKSGDDWYTQPRQ
jgi:hypothetical protein